MMDETQWWSLSEATHGLPIYVPFGTWRTAISDVKRNRADERKSAILLPSPKRIVASRRNEGLKKANSQRMVQAQEDLAKLLEIARPLANQAMSEWSNKRGRPNHRARLKDLLEKNGHTISEYRLKQLARELLT